MTITADSLALLFAMIRRFEGCYLKAYLCPAGVWTIGYGATGLDIGPGTVWTKEQAEARLRSDALRFARGALALCPELRGAPLCAIADFAYNLGLGRLKASTLRRRVNAGDFEAAKAELMKWTKGGGKILPGLVKRRKAECALMASHTMSA